MTKAFFDPDDFEATQPTSVAAPLSQEAVTNPAVEKPKFFELKPVLAAPKVEIAQLPAQPIKMPEPLNLPTEFPQFNAPEGYEVDLSDLPIGSSEPLTRKQKRELERLTGSDVIAEAVAAEPQIEAQHDYEPDLFEQMPDVVSPVVEVSEATGEDFSYLNNQADALFDVSPGLVVEPTTNSIIIDQVQDLTNYTAMVSETGEILTTGAIQLPISLVDNSTGEIQVIQEAAALDSAIQVDNATGFINTIAPMRVTGVVNASSKFKVIPTNLKRGTSHPYLVLAAAIGMVALGAITIAAFMLQII
jgi:hypothetical protein